MIRILIADDHPLIRKGLGQIIEDATGLFIEGEASNGFEVLEKIQIKDFDVIILDISMPGLNGLEVLKQIKIVKPDIPVLILSMYSEEQYAIRALKAGASGYLTKESAPEELVSAIRKIINGGKYISSSLAEILAYDFLGEKNKMPHELLSDREFQVLFMIASGKTVSEIADELFLSVKTVSTYRSRLLGKMNLNNNTELVHYAFKNNIIK
ncbi:response regulator [Candidatus Latescibacterota bacterium]